MEIIPGQITLELLIGDPLLYYIILLAASTLAGLLRGSMESDEAKNGNPEFKGMENLTVWDWTKDAGYGLVGGFIGLATMQAVPIPTLFLPAFGFAGRKILINWGKKAEKTSEETQK